MKFVLPSFLPLQLVHRLGRGLHGRAHLEDPHLSGERGQVATRPLAAEGDEGRQPAGDGDARRGLAQARRRQQLLLVRRLRADRPSGTWSVWATEHGPPNTCYDRTRGLYIGRPVELAYFKLDF